MKRQVGSWVAPLVLAFGVFGSSQPAHAELDHYLVLYGTVRAKADGQLCGQETVDIENQVNSQGRRRFFYTWSGKRCIGSSDSATPMIQLQGYVNSDGSVNIWGDFYVSSPQCDIWDCHNVAAKSLLHIDDTRTFAEYPLNIEVPFESGRDDTATFSLSILSHL